MHDLKFTKIKTVTFFDSDLSRTHSTQSNTSYLYNCVIIRYIMKIDMKLPVLHIVGIF